MRPAERSSRLRSPTVGLRLNKPQARDAGFSFGEGRKVGSLPVLVALLGALLALSPLTFTLRTPAQIRAGATVTIESRSASAGATTIVRISISGVPSPGLGEMRVGPKGEFAYDPQVMEVLDVVGVSPYTVVSISIDNDLGRVQFTASAPEREAKTEGKVVELEVRAVGNPGESTPLRITRIDVFRDPEGVDIPYTIREGTFTIRTVPNQPPQAGFSFSPERPAEGDTVRFTDRSSDPDGEIVSWEWDFGDGTASDKQNPSHRYLRAGIFTVRLTVTDDAGDIGRATREIVVSPAPPNEPPQALFSFSPTRPTTEDTIQFTDRSTDPDGEITFRFWDFGDGSNSTEENPTHKYADSGRYTVVLTVADNRGATDSFSREIMVTKLAVNQPPQANFTFSPPSPTAGDIVQFLDQSTDPDGRVVFWFWSFGDGSTSTLKDPSHRYKAPGTYTVTLKVADDEGATAEASRRLTVSPGPAGQPQADFSFSPENPKPREEVQFTDRSSDPDGEIVR
ncbi:TPA: PKD domain-containing protein, partial [Candidatus Bipolaricaulota bacterium]|nr:PKD domain-containing protein [Candidatus Bipolaricaulota bacterium]